MKKWQLILFGVCCGLLAAGLILLVASPPRGIPITLLPNPTPSPYLVDIKRAVNFPGVYALEPGARILHGIELAGGLLEDADITSVNMAQKVFDGQNIIIPSVSDPIPSNPDNKTSVSSSQGVFPIDINNASSEQLESLPGIGPSKAAEIIKYRETNGPFNTLEELLLVPGIGQGICDQIKDLIFIQ